jgi:hypothetical protein
VERTIKPEARSGWGDVETIEVGRLKRRVIGLTVGEVGLTLADGKDLLSELQRLVLQTQMEEYRDRLKPGGIQAALRNGRRAQRSATA